MLQTRLSRSPPRGVGQGAPRTLAGVRSPPPRQHRRWTRMVDSTQATKPQRRVPDPGKGRRKAAGLTRLLRGCFHSCKNPLQVQVRCLQPPRSSGGAVPGSSGPRFLV